MSIFSICSRIQKRKKINEVFVFVLRLDCEIDPPSKTFCVPSIVRKRHQIYIQSQPHPRPTSIYTRALVLRRWHAFTIEWVSWCFWFLKLRTQQEFTRMWEWIHLEIFSVDGKVSGGAVVVSVLSHDLQHAFNRQCASLAARTFQHRLLVSTNILAETHLFSQNQRCYQRVNRSWSEEDHPWNLHRLETSQTG